MNPPPAGDLWAFHEFVGDLINSSDGSLSPEEALDEWRRLHPATEAVAGEVAAIQEALDDIENGDIGIPFEEFDHSFRTRHNLQPRF